MFRSIFSPLLNCFSPPLAPQMSSVGKSSSSFSLYLMIFFFPVCISTCSPLDPPQSTLKLCKAKLLLFLPVSHSSFPRLHPAQSRHHQHLNIPTSVSKPLPNLQLRLRNAILCSLVASSPCLRESIAHPIRCRRQGRGTESDREVALNSLSTNDERLASWSEPIKKKKICNGKEKKNKTSSCEVRGPTLFTATSCSV